MIPIAGHSPTGVHRRFQNAKTLLDLILVSKRTTGALTALPAREAEPTAQFAQQLGQSE